MTPNVYYCTNLGSQSSENCECKLSYKLDHKSRMVCVGSKSSVWAAQDLSESTQLAQFIPKPTRYFYLDGRPRNTFWSHFRPTFSPKSIGSLQKVKDAKSREFGLHRTSQIVLNSLSLFRNPPGIFISMADRVTHFRTETASFLIQKNKWIGSNLAARRSLL